jgi:hypothetical protein
MKKITIFKRKVNIAVLTATVIFAGAAGCKKGTFDINNVNPNSPSSVPPQYTLTSALAGTANLMYSAVGLNPNVSTGTPIGGNQDIIDNWMGYWTQSGAYTPSNTYVLYQLTSGTGSGNWDAAYNNLSNYHSMITTAGTNGLYANYRAVGMIMTAFVYQRIVDLYNSAPYTGALVPNAQFSYKYDSGSTIYKAITAKLDSAVIIIKNNPSAAALGSNDVMFQGDMSMWTKFAATLKLKILMRQTASSANGSLGDAGVKAALNANNPATGLPYAQGDFLGAGQDGIINPGYSNAADNQENPLYLDVVATANGSPGTNQKYFRANSYAVDFYFTHNDPRVNVLYYPNNNGVVQGRAYGSTSGAEPNSLISAITAFGANSAGAFNGPSVGAPIIPAFESLFLQAEAIQRGYFVAGGNVVATYNSAVAESFRLVGVPSAATAAATYTSQGDPFTNLTLASNYINTIITQKWAACNGIDPVESYSDYRRLGIPAIPISIYPGVTVTHIPYRLPYPTSELNYNAANVPDGGTGTESLTSKIFWMP